MEPEGSLLYSQEPATGPFLSQINPVHTFQPYFPKTHSNLRLGLPSGLFSSGFPTRILYAVSVSPMRATCPTPLPRFDNPNSIWWSVKLWCFSLCSIL
jgi:hypothetical protein